MKLLSSRIKDVCDEKYRSYVDEIVNEGSIESFCYLWYYFIIFYSSSFSISEFPLCPNCSYENKYNFQSESKEMEDEINQYTELLDKLNNVKEPDDNTTVEELNKESEEISHEIGELREKREDNNSDNSQYIYKLSKLKKLEQSCIEESNAIVEIESLYNSEIDSVEQQKKCKNAQLDTLKRTNVLNDVCFIWFDESYATISGFRLGADVDNHEISAGLGQAAMLLKILAKNMGYEFKKYNNIIIALQ